MNALRANLIREIVYPIMYVSSGAYFFHIKACHKCLTNDSVMRRVRALRQDITDYPDDFNIIPYNRIINAVNHIHNVTS